jgi:hypothetical protein
VLRNVARVARILAVGAADMVRDGERSVPVDAVGIGLVRPLATSCGLLL